MMSFDINSIAILNIHTVDCCIIFGISKSQVMNLLKNVDLSEKKWIIVSYKNFNFFLLWKWRNKKQKQNNLKEYARSRDHSVNSKVKTQVHYENNEQRLQEQAQNCYIFFGRRKNKKRQYGRNRYKTWLKKTKKKMNKFVKIYCTTVKMIFRKKNFFL